MVLNFNDFFGSKNKNSKMGDFQDLEHIDGVALSTISAKLYNPPRDDLVLFYFRNEQILQLYIRSLQLYLKT